MSGHSFQGDNDRFSGRVIPNTDQPIKPLVARGTRFEPLNPGLKDFPNYLASQAVTSVVSPDKKTLRVLTLGYNLVNATSGSADNDYAVGLLVQTIAKSQYKDNTLIFIIEDDSQDGGDHADSHRSIAFVVGPYVKQKAVVSNAYNTVDFIRTMEEILGLTPLNLNDSVATPMADVFDLNQTQWTYTATASSMLIATSLPLPSSVKNTSIVPKSTHEAAYWANATKGINFSVEDHIEFNRYNHILWQGLMGNRPYPEVSSGLDLRQNRTVLLQRYAESHAHTPQAEPEPNSWGLSPRAASKYRTKKPDLISMRPILVTAILLISSACGVAAASSLNVSVSGQFSSSVTPSQLIAPGGKFVISFYVPSTPMASHTDTLGFDTPFSGFEYQLNGSKVAAAPEDVRFAKAGNLGLFTLFFGPESGFASNGIAIPEFSFSGGQAFFGSTTKPTILAGSYPLTGWSYSDSLNFDSHGASDSAVTILAGVPEPQPAGMLLSTAGLFAAMLFWRKSFQTI